ncbi:MAG: hypothetical protein ACRC2H_09635 [Silanimonas sp.]
MADASSRAAASDPTRPAWLDDETLQAVRPQVRALLEQSLGFRALPVEQQREMAQTMVRVASYMANPHGLARDELDPDKAILARAQDATEDARKKASGKLGTFAGADFKAGATEAGVEQFGNLVKTVDFPTFVGGLIQNVFQAIVNASIEQMEAYGTLLKSVAQTVGDFANDNITEDAARSWMVDRFPGEVGWASTEDDEVEEGKAPPPRRITGTAEDSSALAARLTRELQLAQPLTDLDDPQQEARAVAAARLQLARSRQQLLASMVLLGINRIVVTDGSINAKVVFSMRASDEAIRRARASMRDTRSSSNTNVSAAAAWAPWGAGGTVNVNKQSHMATVSSSVDEQSESMAEVKSKLTGEVRVNFKSDFLPMEKMASPGMIAMIQGNAAPFDPNARGAAATAPAAAPAA